MILGEVPAKSALLGQFDRVAWDTDRHKDFKVAQTRGEDAIKFLAMPLVGVLENRQQGFVLTLPAAVASARVAWIGRGIAHGERAGTTGRRLRLRVPGLADLREPSLEVCQQPAALPIIQREDVGLV